MTPDLPAEELNQASCPVVRGRLVMVEEKGRREVRVEVDVWPFWVFRSRQKRKTSIFFRRQASNNQQTGGSERLKISVDRDYNSIIGCLQAGRLTAENAPGPPAAAVDLPQVSSAYKGRHFSLLLGGCTRAHQTRPGYSRPLWS